MAAPTSTSPTTGTAETPPPKMPAGATKPILDTALKEMLRKPGAEKRITLHLTRDCVPMSPEVAKRQPPGFLIERTGDELLYGYEAERTDATFQKFVSWLEAENKAPGTRFVYSMDGAPPKERWLALCVDEKPVASGADLKPETANAKEIVLHLSDAALNQLAAAKDVRAVFLLDGRYIVTLAPAHKMREPLYHIVYER